MSDFIVSHHAYIYTHSSLSKSVATFKYISKFHTIFVHELSFKRKAKITFIEA